MEADQDPWLWIQSLIEGGKIDRIARQKEAAIRHRSHARLKMLTPEINPSVLLARIRKDDDVSFREVLQKWMQIVQLFRCREPPPSA